MISVLYVDDETTLLEITKIYMEQTGEFTVDTSPSRVDSHQSQGRTRSGGLNVRLTPEFFLTLDL